MPLHLLKALLMASCLCFCSSAARAVTSPALTPVSQALQTLRQVRQDTTPPRQLSDREMRRLDEEIKRLERREQLEEMRMRRGLAPQDDDIFSPEAQKAKNNAIVGFVVSLGGLVLLSWLGLPAYIVGVVFSSKALRRMRKLGINDNRGLAVAGLVIGIIGLALTLLVLIVLFSGGFW